LPEGPGGFVRQKTMSSLARINANRANAKKSTGPRTLAGKAVSRANACRHGMRAKVIFVMHGEDRKEYNELFKGLCSSFNPRTRDAQIQVKNMTNAYWRLDRLKGIESALFSARQIDTSEIDRVYRWQTSMENACYKAGKALANL
jgi:hypothetical protein